MSRWILARVWPPRSPILEGGIKTVFIDRTGKAVFSIGNYMSFGFSDGRAAVISNFAGTGSGETQLGFIDNKGKVLVKPQYDFTYFQGISDFTEKLRSVKRTATMALLIRMAASKLNFNSIPRYAFPKPGAVEDANGRWGFIDKTGRYVIQPQFSQADSFHEGLAPVMKESSNLTHL